MKYELRLLDDQDRLIKVIGPFADPKVAALRAAAIIKTLGVQIVVVNLGENNAKRTDEWLTR